jgi:HAD superfamily hydrolase (TIGR01509 family)
MLRAALFDVDGTLVDSNDLHAEAWGEIFRRHGVDLPHAAIRAQIGKGGDNLLPALLPADLVARAGEAMEAERAALFRDAYLARVRPFPGVRAAFERLKASGARIALASSATAEEVAHHCDMLDIADLVDGATSADDVGRSKPCPDIFEAAAKCVGVAPEEGVVIGDTPWDMQAAVRAGSPAIGVRCGGFDGALLLADGARALFDGPWALPGALDRWV